MSMWTAPTESNPEFLFFFFAVLGQPRVQSLRLAHRDLDNRLLTGRHSLFTKHCQFSSIIKTDNMKFVLIIYLE